MDQIIYTLNADESKQLIYKNYLFSATSNSYKDRSISWNCITK